VSPIIQIENDCFDCPSELCIGSRCKYLNVPHFYCDDCGEESKLYWFEDMQLCIDCIEERLEEVHYDE
jgi:hypothetical protein